MMFLLDYVLFYFNLNEIVSLLIIYINNIPPVSTFIRSFMLNSSNHSEKMMTVGNQSIGSLKYSLKNKSKRVQQLRRNHQTQKFQQKTLGYQSIYKANQKTKDKISYQTDNLAQYLQGQSLFNCLQSSKTVLKFNRHTQISLNENQLRRNNKQTSDFSSYTSSKIKLFQKTQMPISEKSVGSLYNQSHISYFMQRNKHNESFNNVNTQLNNFSITETSEKFSLKKKDNFQMNIKSHCYPCFKYSDITMPIKKINKQQLRQIQELKHLVYKSEKQNPISKILCSSSKSNPDEGCLCFPKCFWINRWINMPNRLSNQAINIVKQNSLSKLDQIFKQIQKDIPRTQINNKSLSSSTNKQKLRDVLRNYARLDADVGYVQGMNIIASVIIYHSACSATGYEVFLHLMQSAGLRKIYLNDLSFAKEISQELMKELKNISFDLYTHLNNQTIDVTAFLSSWYFSLMGAFIPLEYMHIVIDKFFRKSWVGINEIIITILLYKKSDLMNQDDEELLQCFSTKELQETSALIDWRDLLLKSQNILLKKGSI